MLRKLLWVVGVWSVLFATSLSTAPWGAAFAADMAAKAHQPSSQPLYAWGGCFVGGDVGAGWHRIEQSQIASTDGTVFTPPIDWGSSQHADFIGGGQVGCNYQFSENWVLGAQEMFDFGDIKSSNNLPDPRLAAAAPFQNTTTHEIITATARLGYLFTPQFLGYVKGGGAWTRTSTAVFFSIPAVALSESADADRSGWTVGGGLEWMFAPNWSVFAEYNYMDFGSHNITFTAAPGALGAPSIVSTRLTLQTAEVGVNWRFTSLLGAAPH